MKLLKLLLNRVMFISLSIVLQMTIYILLVMELMNYWIFFVLSMLLSVIIFVKVILKENNPAQKIMWICVILLFPLAGFVIYLMLGEGRWTKRQKRKMQAVLDKQMPENSSTQDISVEYVSQANYLRKVARTNAYRGCKTKYYPTGEKYFKSLIEDLKSAEKFIFLEFFIIEKGKMWGAVLDVLKEKVKLGVEVRVMYDDLGCVLKLPTNYYKKLRDINVKCVRFNKYTPFVTNLHNNRDHRKIVVIDGKIGYTGGINLADEYINEGGKKFYWKDTAVRIEGNAVCEFTEMFLQLWDITSKTNTNLEDYLTRCPAYDESGVVIPFGAGPQFFYNNPVAEDAFINMITHAKREIIITTPYLIIDYSLNRALISAVARGAKVKIVIPGVPDKKLVYLITKHNAKYLKDNGVEIYRAKGSFLHAKSIVVDGEVGIIGTINFDFRSLLHHFENAVWMHDTNAVRELRLDVSALCNDENEFKDIKINLFEKVISAFLKIFTPLF